MSQVVTFGEIMLRLSTERFLRFTQARTFGVTYGGGEFNVAVALTNLGIPSKFVTRLPANEIGDTAMQEIKKLGIGHQHILRGGDRLGIYFLETGAGTRPSNVVYDRAGSSMATIHKGLFDWEEIFKDATWFHWSGITPAISEQAALECLEALKIAKKLNLTISTDLNYRSKLWKWGKEPKDIMPELLSYSHLILGDIDTAYFMLGRNKVQPNYQDDKSLPVLYNTLFDLYPQLKLIATTLRYSVSASHQRIGGLLYDKEQIYRANIKEVTPVVDRVGSGDAFMGGLTFGLLDNPLDKQRAIDIAVASCCLKHTVYGDYNLVSLDDIERFINGEHTGKVSR
ncbi:PfkB family carbohydrate kinase [Aquimarina sp. W85]|uniref:PfkB family carbohydrate kinase n=1 Tax=Aquimarina rhodophyticola TaxID=3342246 RepID=UPI00367202BA